MIVKTDAIVLKTFDFRETSRIATFFTLDHGKVKGILKGIRKDHKKFGSNIDRFSVNEIMYYPSRSDLHLVSHCDLKEYFFPVRQDYKRNVAANYILELVDAIMPTEEKNKEIYQLMHDYLASLGGVKDIDKLVYIFQVKALLYSGFRPHVDSCLRCQKKVHGQARFSLSLGGLICEDCPVQETSFTLISSGAVRSILHIERSPWASVLRLTLNPSIKKELKYILNNFLIYHLDKRLKSTKYL